MISMPRFISGLLICCGLLVYSLGVGIKPAAGDSHRDPWKTGMDTPIEITVVPGDTLAKIADRYGTTVHSLLTLNHLQSPGHIYPGQTLIVPRWWQYQEDGVSTFAVPTGASLLDVSRRLGVTWDVLAGANRLLSPVHLVPGYVLHVPAVPEKVKVAAPELTTPLAGAIAYQLPEWTVRRMNPRPVLAGESLLISGTDSGTGSSSLPHPLREVAVSTQPLIRGSTVRVNVQASQPVTCSLQLEEQVTPCYLEHATENAVNYLVLMGLSPLMPAGRYTATLMVTADGEDTSVVTLPLLVAAGRYDYERIDLPPGWASSSDPALSQAERDKIAALRSLQTPEKYWILPFDFPLPGSVTSYYGSRRSYGYGFTSFHAGTDFQASVGVPVRAPAAGTVVLADPLVVRGNAVMIDHGWGVLSGYWHLSRIDVAVGQVLERGDLIGAVGNTGASTGPHLHWEMWVHGAPVSPLQWVTMDP